ncbi:very short patch repair endonuclease [Yoonia sp.]|uniref:very short patch repair endonuclease n=1 Tax=Yoonia sp. TaxID=2212373 RepID=UPI0025E14F73|nr:very short patch repair endonuclease [Yoonia sp.]
MPEKTPMTRSEMMSRIGTKNTEPELKIRRGLHRRGFRYRLHRNDLPGKPDIVLPRHNVVILVHGCFWHGHQGCRYFRVPRSNPEFWETKIQKNRDRDARQVDQLADQGWRVSVIWECATRNYPTEELADKIAGWISGNEKRDEIAEHTGASTEMEPETT